MPTLYLLRLPALCLLVRRVEFLRRNEPAGDDTADDVEGEEPEPPEARAYTREIDALMAGPGTWVERAEKLTEDEIRRLARAFRGLDHLMTRLYYGAFFQAAEDERTYSGT